MKLGKATRTVLNRSVLKNIKKIQNNVLTVPKPGIDANGFITPGGDEILTAMATLTGEYDSVPYITAMRALNNLYVSHARPCGITISLTVPHRFEETDLKVWMRSLCELCEAQNIDLLGGQTSISHQVTKPVITVNAIGMKRNEADNSAGFVPNGQTILLTKQIGMEATIRLGIEKGEELSSRYTKSFVSGGSRFLSELSLEGEFEAIHELSNTNSNPILMHDVAEGGIFCALWEISELLDCGLEVDLKKIAIKQETIEFCEFYDLNPYMLLSGGCTLILTNEPDAVLGKLNDRNIPASVIGNLTNGKDKVIRNEDEVRYLEPFKGDEIYKVLN